jgi:REP element-mobilizing transposase RayT
MQSRSDDTICSRGRKSPVNEEQIGSPGGTTHAMGSSYISIHIHVVFSTKGRVRSIKGEIEPKLWAYMAGIAENHSMHAVKIGGIDDHVHLLINLGGKLGISKAVQLIKTNSSGWMNEHPGPPTPADQNRVVRGPRAAVRVAGRIFCLQRQPVAGGKGHAIYCEPEETPQED